MCCHPVSSGYTGFYCAECWDTETLRSIAKIDVFSRSESNISQCAPRFALRCASFVSLTCKKELL